MHGYPQRSGFTRLCVNYAVLAFLLLQPSHGQYDHNDKPLLSTALPELRFTQPMYNVSIPENSVGKTYASLLATNDVTIGSNRMGIDLRTILPAAINLSSIPLDVKYKITSGDKDKFFKAEERLVGDFMFLSIRTRTGTSDVLNRERRDKYVLEVHATVTRRIDSHKLVLNADTTVIVKVQDTNDLKPLFYPTEYEQTVPEDTPLHKSIIKVTAEDADLGRNGEIYYSFLETTDQFAIHPMSGVVTLTRPLLYSEHSYHELTVLGQDRGASSRSTKQMSKAKVHIRVKQVNLHPPEIYIQHLPHILEHSNADIYAIIKIIDKDPGIHGQIKSIDIVDGDPDGHFRIRPTKQKNEYNVEVLKLLDREKTPQGYNLTLRVRDRGIPTLESYKYVPVQLADLNDNPPIFSRELYEVKVPETAPINTPVIRLKVSDLDVGKNSEVSLEIVGGNEGGEFRINPETGMLYTCVTLDAEQKPFYTLTVSAIDQGNIGTRKQSSAKVKINVLDTNDNDPVFEKVEQIVWLDENEPTGTSVTKVLAKDRDSGENAYISYSIANLKPVPFEIDHFTGVIRTRQVLDYESMRREYILHIRASDWGLPYRRQAEMQLTIKIKDINDNRPQFEKVDCSGRVPTFIQIGSELMTLSAIDFDRGNIISYRIESGNEDNCFNLDATSGVLSVSCDISDLRTKLRELNVTATDGTHFADTMRIQMHLVNAKRQMDSVGLYLTDELGNFECRDTGVARRLTEVLAAGEKNNQITAATYQEEFGMVPSRYGQNIHTPEFVNFPTEITVNESMALGVTLVKLKARDRDLGYNGKLIYGISNGDEDSVFCIDPDSGEIKIIGYLDRERESEYYLNVTAYDLGKPQKSTSKILPILVLDVNDNPPKFQKTLASFRVTENALNGTVLFHANATDADLGDNGKVSYSLVTDTKEFCIDSNTGVLMVCAPLDREKQEVYELIIRAKDGGGKLPGTTALFSDAVVKVTIDDINDNAPKFSLPNHIVKIREDIPVGTVVAVVTASDLDLGPGGEVVYSLLNTDDSDSLFKIDKLTGTVRTTGLLDFETRQVHMLSIIASDRGLPSLSSETILTVNVVDVNENTYAPQFTDFVLEGSVLENQPVGTEVLKVTAVDADPPGDDSRVSYSIKGGDGVGYFTIDNHGVIRTFSVLDTESKSSYWLTIFAEDNAVVPLHSSVEVYIKVLNQNDNAPLTIEPVYYANVVEESPAGVFIALIKATDADHDPDEKLSYKFASGNAEGFFQINSTTGFITTTARKLDRESQSEHILEVTVSDNGQPFSLSSTTRIIITVDDINDHSPEFEQKFYKAQIPASATAEQALFQDSLDYLEQSDSVDMDLDSEFVDVKIDWELFSLDEFANNEYPSVYRVLAFDEDTGVNGNIEYSLKSKHGKGKFKIHPSTGIIYATRTYEAGQEYELVIRATDGGEPSRSQTCRLSLQVIATPSPQASNLPPVSAKSQQRVEVTENDAVGFLVAQIQATDPDNDTLWFDIVDGDTDHDFYIGRDNGNVLLAHKLDREIKDRYNLTISISDTINTITVALNVSVLDTNDHRPEFNELFYKVDISEAVAIDTEVLKVDATDADLHQKLFYTIHATRHPSSLDDFRLDSFTGVLTLARSLDRETIDEHLLTVMVRDDGTPTKKNFARVLITVHDHNDHAPQFSLQILQGKIYESASVGSAVLRAYAIDRDHGDNARVTYSITSGNIGNVFNIDPDFGTIQLARDLDLSAASEYTLQIKATDHGQPPLSSSVPAHIMITMADNAPPKFIKSEVTAEIFENQPIQSYVIHLEARSTSSLVYEIIDGNTNNEFSINPSTGIIQTLEELDYEKINFYNLTVQAKNMAGTGATCNVIVHVLDRNDNAPRFVKDEYTGFVVESAPIGSLILTNDSVPLVIKAEDDDADVNALLHYDIVETMPQQYFSIDETTGALRTVKALDHELNDLFVFHVKVSDLGKPRLSSDTTSLVRIHVMDINDTPPRFQTNDYNVTLLLPTYNDVTVLQVNATDLDENSVLRYDILDGNRDNAFKINAINGIMTVQKEENLKTRYKLHVRVSDGKFSSIAYVNIRVEKSENSNLAFQKDRYDGTVLENSTKIVTVCVVNVVGTDLNEDVTFSILNPTTMFEIGSTSGVVRTTGVKFDRESKDRYELIVEAKSYMVDFDRHRVARVIVNVVIVDVNDNCPMFVNLPYYAVVSVDDHKGQIITKVHAIDLDANENGDVRYELSKGHGELFKVNRRTGEIELRQNLEAQRKQYNLVISAFDGGITPCSTDVNVIIKVIDRSMPVFKKQFYSNVVAENIEMHSPLSISVEAESPLGRKLIYSIVKGNELEEFSLDFNTAPDTNNGPCVISVIDELDYEQKPEYELTVRATDSVSGVFAEVPVLIQIQDANDCPPEFLVDSYNVSISEAAPVGSVVLKVFARDNDTGINARLQYSIQNDHTNASDYFYIDSIDGTIFLKQPLDHETTNEHHFVVVANDQGVPTLSNIVHIFLNVLDMNDNPPKFDQPLYRSSLSVQASRGQFVTVLTASDADSVDQGHLKYTIMHGNELQTFLINSDTGVISLLNLANFGEHKSTLLNVSVSDGVYTNFCSLRVDLLPANLHSPTFAHIVTEVKIPENKPKGHLVAVVHAVDLDFGNFGNITYTIESESLRDYFQINDKTGEITTRFPLDREQKSMYEIPVRALDGGGRLGFTTVRVRILDENDNAPVFYLREYKACIHSNHTIGSPFLKVRAKDLDEADAARIEYSIYEKQHAEVNELFAINPTNGGIFLIKNAAKWESQTFQFFIRAKDTGSPSLHSDVPVNIFIMSNNDIPPVFERKDDKFFLSENASAGTVITRLKMVSNVSVTYRIISGSEMNPEFTVDDQGQLTLARQLDYEVQDSYLIGVVAETDSSPPFIALIEINLQVLDENDHAPQFESSPYVVSVAENIDEGTYILKVIAHDQDQGSNSEVRYSLESDQLDTVNVFAVDAYTGWITTLVQLDKERKDEYKFQIVAMDNGHPRHTTRTTVIVKLIDYNDSPPIFDNDEYETSIQEDAAIGTILVQTTITDADKDAQTAVNYYIVGGDIKSQFSVKPNGQVYLTKPVDRESISQYYLDLIATDGLFMASTKVVVTITDVNDNPPYCLRYRYRRVLSEGVYPGTFILNVQATDMDDPSNSKPKYYLTGEGSDHFTLDAELGHLKTARSLDRETQARFNLIAHVQDKEHVEWECSSQVELIISDLNDNPPVFSLPYYSVTLPEDAEIGTLITKVHATDADIGINRKIKYHFIDSAGDHFKISPDNGIITLAKPLDREQKSTYNITIQAADQGNQRLFSVANVIINVQDINDNPPEFANKYYYVTIPEISVVGSEVTRVLATSKDAGINADVYYSIIGGNEHKKFAIDRISGVIKIAEQLDYERAKDYFLTIQAIDGGDPPLSNLATVNITIMDNNDNVPIFSQVSYTAMVNEDATIGEEVIQITAVDLDSGQNGRVTYSIKDSSEFKQFQIDESTGLIAVASLLDRETIASYSLEIIAVDNGQPQLSTRVDVLISVQDANDNPPKFSQQNYTVVIQEDKPIGHVCLKFIVTDADISPNSAPFTFDFISGNEGGSFRIEQDGHLRTASRFNHKFKTNYLLHIRVFDNGTPPLFSDTWVIVKIIEESQYPPIITPVDISINSYLDEYPGGVIGKVYASDQDKYDTLVYSLSPTIGVPYPLLDLFQIDPVDGTLKAYPRLDVGEYRLNVTVTDMKFFSHVIVKVNVDVITEDMLKNAVIIRFKETTPQEFILSHKRGFIHAVRNILNCRLKDVSIISVQSSDFAEGMINASTHSSPWNSLSSLNPGNPSTRFGKRELEMINSIDSLDSIDSDLNDRSRSIRSYNELKTNNHSKKRKPRDSSTKSDLDVLFTVRKPPTTQFYSPEKIRKSINDNVETLEQSTKLIVEEVVRLKCSPSICVNGKCKDRVIIDSRLITTISTDVTSFVSPKHQYKIDCECREGFGGEKCDLIVNECAREPCSKFKLCIPDASIQGYTCQCPEGFAGVNCDIDTSKCHDQSCYVPRNPVSFTGKSYAQYEVKNVEQKLLFNVRVRTLQPSGTIMFAVGVVDYNILEILNGVVQYRFELGNGEGLVRVSTLFVSDGNWHEIQLERDGSRARVSVDNTHVAHGSAPGPSDILNIQDNDIYLGAQVRQHPSILGFEDIQRGFFGCLDDIRVSRVPLPLHKSGATAVATLKRFTNVEFSCDVNSILITPGPCGSQPCLNGGTCKELGSESGFECVCHSRFTGSLCEVDTNPCASSPCLFGGTCTVTASNDFQCDCKARLVGKRCEYGYFCNPNPCRHGGACEEGDLGPLCKCRDWIGETCDVDLDECETSPCQNGGTCVNEPGSYRCFCPPNTTGTHCASLTVPTNLTARLYNITLEEYIIAICVLSFIILLILIYFSCRRCRKNRLEKRRQQPNVIQLNDRAEKSLFLKSPHDVDTMKRVSKKNNLEVSRDNCITRPLSYTSTSNNDTNNIYSQNNFMNNFNSLTSYGSAGDELENVYPKKIVNNFLDATTTMLINNDPDKSKWAEQMHLPPSLIDHNSLIVKKDDCVKKPPIMSETTLRFLGHRTKDGQAILPHGIEVDAPTGRIHNTYPMYNWDCSDWARRSQNPLPDITEVPGNEIQDSSSFHSNDSNESKSQNNVSSNMDSTLDVLRYSDVDSKDGLESSSKVLNSLDSNNEDYRFSTDNYLRHPNSYLPKHTYNIPSDTSEVDRRSNDNRYSIHSPSIISDSELDAYGFTGNRNRRNLDPDDDDDDGRSVITTLDERHSLLGGYNVSNSDLSTHNVCEIDDSECETETKPLNWVHQTAV